VSYKLRVGTAGAMEEDLADTTAEQATDEAETEEGTPKSTSPSATPWLSGYVKAKKEWKGAKAAAEKSVAALKATILQQCDPELEGTVKPRIDVWDGILTVVDDGLVIPVIDAAMKEADEKLRAAHNQKLAGSFKNMLAALQQHPLASVADANPFGKFYIRAPLNLMLTKLETTFGAEV
jgi:hypothetical protein